MRLSVAGLGVGLLAAFVIVTTSHCTIDHIAHVYCNVPADCDTGFTCDPMHHSCILGDGGVPVDIGDGMTVGPDMFCSSSTECSDVAPICAGGRCRACMDSGDDAQCLLRNSMTPRCESGHGDCVQCLMSSDCGTTPATPVCNTTAFTCRKCAANSECASGICASDGTCASTTDIAYVNNASGACMDIAHTSTPAAPFCQIQYAATNSSKPYVLVSASATAYNALNLATTTTAIGPLTIVGPAGRGTAMKATIMQAALPALLATSTAAPLTLVIDGLDLQGGTSSAGAKCNGGSATATLTIKNSTIEMSGAEGVISSGCTLTLDANIISANTNQGVKLTTTTYVVTNNIIHHNGSTGGLAGIDVDGSSMGTMAFDTIAANGGANTVAGGVTCATSGTMKLIEESIIAQNAQMPATNGTQLAGRCQLQAVVTGPDSFTGAMQAPPAFVSITDFHLDVTATGLAANQTCCINKIMPAPSTPNVTHDVDEGARPKVAGTGLDIGAHEAQ